jgi:AcrR family transcriptional regulator
MSKTIFSKKCIADALLELLAVKPINDITIQDIADKSGYTRVTYYRHFNSLEDVITYYLDSYADEYLYEHPMDFDTLPPREFVTRFFTHFLEPKAKNTLEILKKQNLLPLLKKNFDKYMLLSKKNDHSEYGYLFVAGGLFNVYEKWVENGYKESPEQLADMFIKFFKDHYPVED